MANEGKEDMYRGKSDGVQDPVGHSTKKLKDETRIAARVRNTNPQGT